MQDNIRSTTPDSQLLSRARSTRIPSGGGKGISLDIGNMRGSNSFDGALPDASEPEDLAADLSELTLSGSSVLDKENRVRSTTQQEICDHRNQFYFQGDPKHIEQYPHLNSSELGNFHSHPMSRSANGSYGCGVGLDMKNYSLLADVSAKSYSKGPLTPTVNTGGGSPSQYRKIDSPRSSLSDYGLSGYGINPPSPPMLGSQLGTGSLPPFLETAAAMQVIGVPSMNTGKRGGLALRPSLIAAAAELQNHNRIGNPSAGSLQVPHIDPLYVQHLRSMVGNNMNDYVDLLELHKAYPGGPLVSPMQSQYGIPHLGRPANNRGYGGNHTIGLGRSYPGSPLTGAVLPNSPTGSCSPFIHGERSLCFPSGMRNFDLLGGSVGPWHLEGGSTIVGNFASSILEEFKNNKTKVFELSQIAGHVVEFRYILLDNTSAHTLYLYIE